MSTLPNNWKPCKLATEVYKVNQYDVNWAFDWPIKFFSDKDKLSLNLWKGFSCSKKRGKVPFGWKPCDRGNFSKIVKGLSNIYVTNASTKNYNWPIECVRLYKPNYPFRLGARVV